MLLTKKQTTNLNITINELNKLNNLLGRTTLTTQINKNINFISNAYQNDYMTIYTRLGDFFVFACITFTLFILIIIFII